MKTFEILEFKRTLESLQSEVDDETGEFLNTDEQLEDFVDEFEGLAEDKIKAIQHVINSKKSEIEINKQEISCIQSTNKTIDKEIISLNDVMSLLLKGEGLKTNVGSFYYGKETLYIANESQFKKDNPEYIKMVPTVSKQIDKELVRFDIDKLTGAKLRKGVIFRAKKVKE